MFCEGSGALLVGCFKTHVSSQKMAVIKVESAKIVEESDSLGCRIEAECWAAGGEIGEHLDGETGFIALYSLWSASGLVAERP